MHVTYLKMSIYKPKNVVTIYNSYEIQSDVVLINTI